MTKERPTYLVLGADLANPNRGVQALARCAVSLLHEANPTAELVVQGFSGRHESLPFNDGMLKVRTSNPWAVTGIASVRRGIGGRLRKLFGENGVLEDWSTVDAVLDVSGGDSFTTIYGPGVFDRQCRVKEAVLEMGIGLVLLPQTFGPFIGSESQSRARAILEQARLVATREAHGEDELRRTLSLSPDVQVETVPDVAMTMKARRPEDRVVESLEAALGDDSAPRVGVNVSGLLYFGDEGPGRSLEGVGPAHYREILNKLVVHLVRSRGAQVFLTPHVMKQSGAQVGGKSDSAACEAMRKELSEQVNPERVHVVTDGLDCQEVKWVIGQMDMFLGSRMHSCVAACTQGVPTIDLAYSKKALGVMGVLGRQDWVVDLSGAKPEEVLERADRLLEIGADERRRLLELMPSVQSRVRSYFREFLGSPGGVRRESTAAGL